MLLESFIYIVGAGLLAFFGLRDDAATRERKKVIRSEKQELNKKRNQLYGLLFQKIAELPATIATLHDKYENLCSETEISHVTYDVKIALEEKTLLKLTNISKQYKERLLNSDYRVIENVLERLLRAEKTLYNLVNAFEEDIKHFKNKAV